MKRIFALLCGVLLVGCGSNNVSSNPEMNNTNQEVVSNEISQNNIEQNNSTSEDDKNNTSDTNESLEIEEENNTDTKSPDVIHIETNNFAYDRNALTVQNLKTLGRYGDTVKFDNPISTSNSITTVATGGSQEHNNMPPYLTVYMWKRIA